MAKIKDFMTANVVTVSLAAEIGEAARLMRDHDIGALPVVQGDDIKGMITDRDLVIRGLAEDKGNVKVADILSGNMVSLRPDDDDKDAEQLMSTNNVRRLPVIENGRLVGMVSVGDLAVRNDQKRAGKVMGETGPEKE